MIDKMDFSLLFDGQNLSPMQTLDLSQWWNVSIFGHMLSTQ